MDDQKFSLSVIIPTFGRKEQLIRLLNTISNSTIMPLEVIIIDQNHPSFLNKLNEFPIYNNLNILYYNVDFIGLSKAKNFGATKATGEYICFPDDDCEVFPNTFKIAYNTILKTNINVIFGKSVNEFNNDSVTHFSKKEGFLSPKKIDGYFIEFTMFIKKNIITKYPFDENLGIGAFHGAEEGYDLVYRLIQEKIPIYYTPKIKLYHPNKIINYSGKYEIERVFRYRCGFARLCKKHKLTYKYYNRLYKVILYIPFLFIFKRNKLRYYISELLGLIAGRII